MICERCGRLKNRATGTCMVCADHAGAAPPPVSTTQAAAGPEAVGVAAAGVSASSGSGSGAASVASPPRMTPEADARPSDDAPSWSTFRASRGPAGPAREADAPARPAPEPSRYRPAPPAAPAAGSGGVGSTFDPMLHRAPPAAVPAEAPAPAPAPAPAAAPAVRAESPAPRPRPEPQPEPQRDVEVRSVAATLRKATPAPARPAPAPTPDAAAPAPAPAPAKAPASVEDEHRPISVSAAAAFLDLNDDASKRRAMAAAKAKAEAKAAAEAPSPAMVPAVVEAPKPEPRHPGAPVGVVRHGKLRRRSVDVVVYDGSIVIAKRGTPTNLTASQLAAQDPNSRLVPADSVEDAVVREDIVSGQARVHLRNGDELVIRWPSWRNRGTSVENMLTYAFPGKVDQGDPEIVQRTVRVMMTIGIAVLVAVGSFLGASALFKGDPPPPPPPAPPSTLPPVEQMVRAELRGSCPAWLDFAANVRAGDRPDPNAMRPIVDGLRPHFDTVAATAGADASYTTARDEVAYLQDLARKPADAVGRESVSRVHYAMDKVTGSCQRAAIGG